MGTLPYRYGTSRRSRCMRNNRACMQHKEDITDACGMRHEGTAEADAHAQMRSGQFSPPRMTTLHPASPYPHVHACMCTCTSCTMHHIHTRCMRSHYAQLGASTIVPTRTPCSHAHGPSLLMGHAHPLRKPVERAVTPPDHPLPPLSLGSC